MKKIIVYIILTLFLRYVNAQNDVAVYIEPRLSKLYTWDFNRGRYQMILNKNGQITKNYPGGIFLQKFYGKSTTPTYIPVHKPKGANLKTPRTKKPRKPKTAKKRTLKKVVHGSMIYSRLN